MYGDRDEEETQREVIIKRWRADRGHGEAMQAPNKQKIKIGRICTNIYIHADAERRRR